MHSLALAVGLSLLAVGLFGVLASEFETQEHAIPLSEALHTPAGSRVLVRGLLESVREVAGGAALSSLSDCAGGRIAVFFAGGAPADISWRLVVVDASIAFYRGTPELVVADPGHVSVSRGDTQAVEASALREHWRAFLCRAVTVTAAVAWGHVSKSDATSIEVGLVAGEAELQVAAHCACVVELTVHAGAVATFSGVIAAAANGAEPVLHVRL